GRLVPPGARSMAITARSRCGPPMRWAELDGALRARGVIRSDDALRPEAAAGVVTGVAYDSRAVTPGQVFVALKGQHADGTSFARQAIERGAAAVVSEQAAPPDVPELLREMVDRQCGACAMEVSSHALSLRRVDGITFAAGVFTNLTRDHLDFHADMDEYFRAKRRLFEMLPPDAPSLLNVDDP